MYHTRINLLHDHTPVQQRLLKERQELMIKCGEADERTDDLHCQLKATRDSLVCCEASVMTLQAKIEQLQLQTNTSNGMISQSL